jgi:hypothetical protein
MELSRIFPEEDFRLKMRFERGCPADFFRQSEAATVVLTERSHWLEQAADTVTLMTAAAAPLMAEVLELAHSWGTLPEGSEVAQLLNLSALDQCRWLCRRWETDFLLLKPDAEGAFRLCGGALCFPSHWDLGTKMGRTVAEIHDPVPGLNAALGRSIDGFLEKIRPEISWERHNWGLTRSPELNQHPSRELPGLDAKVELDEVWWRLEDQSLIALPRSGGVLFGIRVTVHPLREVRDHAAARAGLVQALETMPAGMATYKGVAAARARICTLLNA